MRKLMTAAVILLVLMVGIALGEGSSLSIDAPREEIRPGRPVIVSFTVPEDGTCSIGLRNEAGAELTVAGEGGIQFHVLERYLRRNSGIRRRLDPDDPDERTCRGNRDYGRPDDPLPDCRYN